MEGVLLLNSSMEPLNVISVKRAFKLLTLGKIMVVEETDEEFRSISLVFYVPSVVQLINYCKHKRFVDVRLSRRNILLRDKFTCQYCGKKPGHSELDIEHIIPKSKGGKTIWKNVVTACRPCNRKKDDMYLPQADMKLIKRPSRPSHVALTVRFRRLPHIPDEWNKFMYGGAEGW